MFGETVTTAAITDYASVLNEARNTGNLSVDSKGTLNTNANGVSVRKNTFYGS